MISSCRFGTIYKDKLAPSFRSKVVYRANCWDCNDFYIGKTKRRLRDRKTEHFKALTTNCHESAIADHVFLTNHKIKWDHFVNIRWVVELKPNYGNTIVGLNLKCLISVYCVNNFSHSSLKSSVLSACVNFHL